MSWRRPRRRFTDDFKQPAVRLVLDEGNSVGSVARELDLVPSARGDWVERAEADRPRGRPGLTTAEREELVRLRKQVRVLEEKRDILNKAAAGRRDSEHVGRHSAKGRQTHGRAVRTAKRSRRSHDQADDA
jgi:transposase